MAVFLQTENRSQCTKERNINKNHTDCNVWLSDKCSSICCNITDLASDWRRIFSCRFLLRWLSSQSVASSALRSFACACIVLCTAVTMHSDKRNITKQNVLFLNLPRNNVPVTSPQRCTIHMMSKMSVSYKNTLPLPGTVHHWQCGQPVAYSPSGLHYNCWQTLSAKTEILHTG